MNDAPFERVVFPKKGEVVGIVESMLGSNRVMVRCEDKKIRLCRIIGKMRKRVWVHVSEAVIVRPWEFQADNRGDIIYKYNYTQANVLRKRGILTI
ncbi:MAG: translation initiation factor eIF-1A [Candidatus Aenigmarchaeota archaeon]|nr:translation initiation factor eIF-1A [Candidatus Aenigmarchaeota archaeon]